MTLPRLPRVDLESLEDLSPDDAGGFLRLRRQRLRMALDRGEPSEPFVFDSLERRALDAVVIAAHYLRDGERHVYLRSAVRPAVALRPSYEGLPEAKPLGSCWELPAGLVEVGEQTRAGLARCAARELHEELGFELDPQRLEPLGPSTFPAAGIIGERHFYFHVEVSPDERGAPIEDGSPLERDALIVGLPLAAALDHLRAGAIEDAKSEIGLRRLAEVV